MSDGPRDAFRFMGEGISVPPNLSKTINKSFENIFKVWADKNKDKDPWDLDWDEDTVRIDEPWFSVNTCDCGAIKTSNPNLHAYWCTAYKDPNK